MTEAHTLSAEAVTLGYGDRTVIDGLDLQIAPGRITSIVGANGCGKSTLLRSLARLLSPASGQIVLDGRSVHSRPTKEVARILGLLPQSPIAPEGITVGDLVKRGRTPWRGLLSRWTPEDSRACAAALAVVGLSEQAGRPLAALSGGQRQRAWIALVLAQDPELLLLDEPTTYLDLVHQIEVLSLLRRRNREAGLTVVTVLHDLNLAARFSDHLVLLGRGGLVATGAPGAVLTPANLRAAFGLDALVQADPVTGTPMVIPRGAAGDAARDPALDPAGTAPPTAPARSATAR